MAKKDLERFLRGAHILARLVERILERGYLERSAGAGVTFDQLNILKFLDRPRVSLVKDVARFLNATYAAASQAVSRLARKGWIGRAKDPEDGRAEVVILTTSGRALIRRYEQWKARRMRQLLRRADPARLADGLEAAIAVLMRERKIAGNPCLGCGAYYSKSCVVRAHGQTCPCQS